jgi:hypothetical protein
MTLGEVTLGILSLFLLIGAFGHLENHAYKTMELVTVPDLVLSLAVANTNVIYEAFKFTLLGLVLHMESRLFHRIDRMIHFPLLVMALG